MFWKVITLPFRMIWGLIRFLFGTKLGWLIIIVVGFFVGKKWLGKEKDLTENK